MTSVEEVAPSATKPGTRPSRCSVPKPTDQGMIVVLALIGVATLKKVEGT